MVRVARLERAASTSQMWRPTNWATPGYSLFCHDTTASDKNKVFSVCGHSCGQNRFCAAFSNRGKSRKCRRRKALRRFTLPRPGYRHGTPKPRASPSELHLELRNYYNGYGEKLQGEKIRREEFTSGANLNPLGGFRGAGWSGIMGAKN